MTNLDIIKNFDTMNMACFITNCSGCNCTNKIRWTENGENIEWLNTESPDGNLYKGNFIWKDYQWVNRDSGKPYYYDKYKFSDCWVLRHIFDILEALLATGNITKYNIRTVIPTIEYRADFDDFRERITYKGYHFNIWSDFFDFNPTQEDQDDDCICICHKENQSQEEKDYLAQYKILKFTHPELVHSIDVYYKLLK